MQCAAQTHTSGSLLRGSPYDGAKVKEVRRLLLGRIRYFIYYRVTPEAIEDVYNRSILARNKSSGQALRVAEMLLPENVIALTAGRRS